LKSTLTLKPGLMGHSGFVYDFLFMFISNYGSFLHLIVIFDFEKNAVTLQSGSGSLKVIVISTI